MKALSILKDRFPTETWKSVRNGFGWRYKSDSGLTAECCSGLVSVHPDDMDGHCQSLLMVNGEVIYRGPVEAIE